MQKRHADRQLYFNEQSITTQKYVIPFIEKHKPITADSHILEIGCGEGGNIKPFLDLGCQVTGIDINGGQIAIAKEIYSVHPNNRNLTLICEDIYKVTELHNKFDIIIIRDVIEHIPKPRIILAFYKEVLKSSRYYFRSLSTLANPFGRSPADLQQQAPKAICPGSIYCPSRTIKSAGMGECQSRRTFGNQRYRHFIGTFSLDRAQRKIPDSRRSPLFHQP